MTGQENRRDVLQLCKDVAADLCKQLGREAALELASERYLTAPKYYQRANWRMIRRLINVRVNSASD